MLTGLTGIQADMLTASADAPGVIPCLEHGTMPDGLPYIIPQPFGSLLAVTDSVELIWFVLHKPASVTYDLYALILLSFTETFL